MGSKRDSYLDNFEELVNDHGVAIQYVFADDEGPGFSYTVGLFEADHPEFIVFGFPEELAHGILNHLASAVLASELRFEGNQRVHELFRNAPAYLLHGRDVEVEYVGTAYAIRHRRYPDLAGTELDVLQLVYRDRSGRWPWDPESDYAEWPLLGPPPDVNASTDVTMPSHG